MTTRSQPKLSEAARHVVIPKGIVTTGFPAVKAKGAELGLYFDPWQEGLGRIALGKRADGKYAATVGGVVMSLPRQVGKTYFVGALVLLLCVLYPNLRVVWTAHRTRTSTNTFRTLQGMARRPKIAPLIEYIRTANGEQEIKLRNGSIIMFGAREQGFGRGFDEIDIEVFDEAQILTEKALEDMVAATNQAKHPHGALLFYMGTPPRPHDPGEVFANKRAKALAGETKDTVYVECSADPDADPDDRAQWAKANPSFPYRTPLESMLRLRENLPSLDSWMREALGIWDQVNTVGVIPEQSWSDQADPESVAVRNLALGVECGPDLVWASIALAGQRADNAWHLELVDNQHTKGRGVAWLIPRIQQLIDANPDKIRSVTVDVAGPVAALLEQRGHAKRWYFKGTNIAVTPVRVAELGTGCALVLDGTVSGWLYHIGQPQLTAAAVTAGKRPLGDTGMWVWARKTSESDITPIQAGTLALIGAQMARPARPVTRRRATGRTRRGVSL